MSQKNVKMVIDGKEVSATEGETILKVATDNGIEIPTMCYLDGLSSMGGCRLCLVEAKGVSKLLPACTTPVNSGMEVVTNSDRLKEHRKKVIELLLSERTHICSVCIANGSCELQAMATKLGVDHVEVARRWTGYDLEATHERFVLDRNRCILCTRCIRVCDEIEGVHTLDLMMRGKDSQVIIDLNEAWGSSYSCTSCTKCSAVCPVGSIYIKGKPLSETKKRSLPDFVQKQRIR
ncbi:MAG: 2Fe-2S iron-sulfur cluster-binding protein [Candidatus Bathyarchaeota archaeon]